MKTFSPISSDRPCKRGWRDAHPPRIHLMHKDPGKLILSMAITPGDTYGAMKYCTWRCSGRVSPQIFPVWLSQLHLRCTTGELVSDKPHKTNDCKSGSWKAHPTGKESSLDRWITDQVVSEVVKGMNCFMQTQVLP
jgi:hypothetical protein